MTTFGYDAPLVGPVLESIPDAIQQVTGTVSATGDQTSVLSGSVVVVVTVLVSGSALTLSQGNETPVVIPPITGTLLTIPSGTVTVIAGDSITVGVSGITLTMAMSSVYKETIFFPSTSQMDLVSGNVSGFGTIVIPTDRIITQGGPMRPQRTIDVLEEQLGQLATSGTLRRHS